MVFNPEHVLFSYLSANVIFCSGVTFTVAVAVAVAFFLRVMFGSSPNFRQARVLGAGERVTQDIILRAQPTAVFEERREVIDYVQKLIGNYLGSEGNHAFLVGTKQPVVPCLCYPISHKDDRFKSDLFKSRCRIWATFCSGGKRLVAYRFEIKTTRLILQVCSSTSWGYGVHSHWGLGNSFSAEENVAEEVQKLFANTSERHGRPKEDKPDAQDPRWCSRSTVQNPSFLVECLLNKELLAMNNKEA
ncbi:hypothetical protein Nepgr_011858 [Nepenthes gracilis]|uniref:Uncharacterized protein n=1 Tax=Nepenthes gracilis TaxID=150966 RepID=A0AAD3XMC0_NEPGR|nr:hypothetical protein Nepgr_011858 [Nepenthes gracilis]